jgi:hypothetical protein
MARLSIPLLAQLIRRRFVLSLGATLLIARIVECLDHEVDLAVVWVLQHRHGLRLSAGRLNPRLLKNGAVVAQAIPVVAIEPVLWCEPPPNGAPEAGVVNALPLRLLIS